MHSLKIVVSFIAISMGLAIAAPMASDVDAFKNHALRARVCALSDDEDEDEDEDDGRPVAKGQLLDKCF